METLVGSLSSILKGQVHRPGDVEYEESINSYFSAQASRVKPACIVRPRSSADVATAVRLLVRANHDDGGIGSIKFAVRGGGHSCFAEGANQADGVTIDLRSLNSIEVNKDSDSMTPQVAVGAGASWGEVYRALDPMGLAVPGGRHSQVGVAGLTLGGGLSHFSGRVGLVCDNVIEYETVLASGAIALVRETGSYADLFSALQGGGNNFGIVTRLVFGAFSQGRLWGGTLIQPLETRERQLQAFYDFVADPAFDPYASLIQSFGMSAERGEGFVNGVVYTKPESEPRVIKPFAAIEPTYMNSLRELSLTELTKEQDAFNENGLCQIMVSTTYHLDLGLLHRTYDIWAASCASVRPTPGIVWSLSLQPLVPLVISHSPFLQQVLPPPPEPRAPDGTGNATGKPSHRPVVIAQLTGTWRSVRDSPAVEAAALRVVADIDAAAAAVEGAGTGYLYLNYAHPSQKVFGEGERRERLRQASRKYDPEGVFQRCVVGGFKLF